MLFVIDRIKNIKYVTKALNKDSQKFSRKIKGDVPESMGLINKCRGTCDYELEDSMCKDVNSFKGF